MAGSTEKSENELFIEILRGEEDYPQKIIKIVRKVHRVEDGLEPPIQKAPRTLREVHTNDNYFEPKMVSLGLYHHRKDLPKEMDYLKVNAVQWFVSLFPNPNSDDDQVRKIYDCFVTKASSYSPSLRNLYEADATIKQLKDEDITFMMFLDGCFILYFIHLFGESPEELMKKLHHSIILRDLFLLENQIPYLVLTSLMTFQKALQEIHIKKFILLFLLEHAFLDTSSSFWNGDWMGDLSQHLGEPRHLLDILRTMLIPRISGPISKAIKGPITSSEHHHKDRYDRLHKDRYYCRSIMELKAKGIKISKSHSNRSSKLEFKEGFIHGHLSLPQMIINDRTRTQLLNLIAYEMCSGFPSNHPHPARVITSYVCFLDCLIDHADDVKELRLKGILRNRLGSDEEVAKLFNEVATNSIPDPMVYGVTLREIQGHYDKKLKRWVAEFCHNHFRSPWTIISLIAAIFFLFLSTVQTIFTVW